MRSSRASWQGIPNSLPRAATARSIGSGPQANSSILSSEGRSSTPVERGAQLDPVERGGAARPRRARGAARPRRARGRSSTPSSEGAQLDPVERGAQLDPVERGAQLDPRRARGAARLCRARGAARLCRARGRSSSPTSEGRSSTLSSEGRSSSPTSEDRTSSQRCARSVTVPSKQPGMPARLAVRLGTCARSRQPSARPAGRPALRDRGWLEIEGERNLRSHEHHRPGGRKPFGKEQDRRDPDTAADEQPHGPFRGRRESPSDRPQHAQPIASFTAGEEPGSRSDFLEQEVEPAFDGVRPHHRHRTAHLEGRIAANVHERSRRRPFRHCGRAHPEHVLPPRASGPSPST